MAATKANFNIIVRGSSNAAFAQLTGCSVTRSGTTATLTKTSHGLSSGNPALIQAFELEEFNGIFPITNVTANTFDYTIKQDPGANPSGSTGTVDKVTLGTALDMTTDYGGSAAALLQNGNTGPNVAAQLWMGTSSSGSAACDYQWRQIMNGSLTANACMAKKISLDMGLMYVNFAVCRNTGQPVDCAVIASHVTAV